MSPSVSAKGLGKQAAKEVWRRFHRGDKTDFYSQVKEGQGGMDKSNLRPTCHDGKKKTGRTEKPRVTIKKKKKRERKQ